MATLSFLILRGTDYVYGVNDRKRYLLTEKVVKFNRTALRNMGKRKAEKIDPRGKSRKSTTSIVETATSPHCGGCVVEKVLVV